MPISAPDKIITPWATSGLKATIPETADPVLGRAGFDQGFPAINMTPKTAGGIPPFGQDFNGIFFDVTQALQFMQAGGTFPYDSVWATAVGGYPVGALVSRTDNQGLWRNTVANNLTDPEAGGAGWQPEGSGLTSVAMASTNVTLTPLQAAREIIVITGTLTADLQLIFPAYVKQWLVVNSSTGVFSVTCKTAAGTGVSASSGETVQVYGDGTNIKNAAQVSSGDDPLGYFYGFQLANNSGAPNTTIDVGAGSARDSLNNSDIKIPVQISGILQSSGAWAAGTGQNKLDTGAKAISTCYHVFAIRKTSDGSADILFSLSATAPTMPSGYAGFALINFIRTNASGNIIPFINKGDMTWYKTPIKDVNLSAISSQVGTYQLSLSSGIAVEALLYCEISGDQPAAYISSPDMTDLTPLGMGAGYVGGQSLQAGGGSALDISGQQLTMLSSSTGTVRARFKTDAAAITGLVIVTGGWRILR
jgi:hypothetical protein